jgi:hypothetical membrane protein
VHVSIPRAGGLAAIAAPVLMWSEFFTHALSRQGYNLLMRPFSDLATRGTPQANEFDLGFFVIPGLLTIVVGAGLWFARREGNLWKLGSLLIVVAGIFLFLTGVFQQDPRSVLAGVLHGTMSQTCFAIASVAPLVLFVGSTRHAHLGAPRRLWLTAGLAAVAIEGVGIAIRPLAHYPDGLFQRPFTVVLTVWFVGTGLWLLRLRHPEAVPARA